jgi:hypothetical protein
MIFPDWTLTEFPGTRGARGRGRGQRRMGMGIGMGMVMGIRMGERISVECHGLKPARASGNA